MFKPLEGITDEGQAHLRCIFSRLCTSSCSRRRSRLQMSGIIGLVNLICREVCRIDIRSQLRLEWCSDTAKSIEFNATEEFMVLDLICTTSAETILCITNKTKL